MEEIDGRIAHDAKAWDSGRLLTRERLPSRFLLSLDDPPDPPAFPEPSATLVLLREGSTDLEVLLLERNPRSGFIPGAWVFPGGRVDPEDGHPEILARIQGLSSRDAERILGLDSAPPPALAFWVAAVRETFEETGVFVGAESRAWNATRRAAAQDRLLAGDQGFRDILEALSSRLDAGALQYCGHWLTPECEPRRYDTRFFITHVPPQVPVRPHHREMTQFAWMSPREALDRNRRGRLPLVLPTLFTLEELSALRTPEEALAYYRDTPKPRRLPRPERTEAGIRFFITD